MEVCGQLYAPAALPPGKIYLFYLTLLSVSQHIYGVITPECVIGRDLEGGGRAVTKVSPKNLQRLRKTIKIPFRVDDDTVET
jgi:hypothetical protein